MADHTSERSRPCAPRSEPAVRAAARELAQRLTGTLEVVLLWHADTDTLSVRVHDPNGGGDFELPVAPAEAMNVFHHPYAYAAARGIEYRRHDETAVTVDV